MRILALDLGKYKTVACDHEAETGRHRFVMGRTTPKAPHDLIVDGAPQRVVIEICSMAGWVGDLMRSLDVELQVANTADDREAGGECIHLRPRASAFLARTDGRDPQARNLRST